jgi:hypothetical protein
MFYKKTPFITSNREDTFKKITNNKWSFLDNKRLISEEAKDLISKVNILQNILY